MPLSIVYQILVDIVSSLNWLNVFMSTLQIYLPYDHIKGDRQSSGGLLP